MINAVLIKYGEIYIRGKNKKQFENFLIELIRKRLKNVKDFEIIKEQGRMIVSKTGDDFDSEYVVEKLKYISGINAICPCVKISNFDIEDIKKTSLEFMQKFYLKNDFTFKVNSTRIDKSYPLTTYEISCDVGEIILDNMSNTKVDVKNPEVNLYIELRTCVYIYSEVIKGIDGLPYGTSGKGILLLSGGIDSPVAGYLMANRGVYLEAVYFHSPPYTSASALQKVKDLCEVLTEYTGFVKLHVINFTETQLYLNSSVDKNKTTIFLKRTMLMVSEKIAEEINAKALVVGDSIGQVASQTLESIYVIDGAVSMPIHRPLVTMNKESIIKIAREIGTFDISIRPFDDCCTLFVPKHPDLKPSKKVVNVITNRLSKLDELIQKSLDEREIIYI